MAKNWKIAFCGLGSIGSRHLRNMIDILEDRQESYDIDWIAKEKRAVPDEFKQVVRNRYTYEEEIDNDYDIIFVTNPTYRHFDTIKKYQWYTKSLYIEKPVFSDDEREIREINPDCLFYIACPIRYKKVIQYVKNNIKSEDVLSAIAICSSYLPEWRKGTDYRKGYSAIKSMGGGVSLDLIHELDYLCYLFGMPAEIYNIKAQVSSLELDSDDVSVYIAKLDQAVVQIHLDYFGRSDMRTLILFCEHDTVQIDLLKNTVKYMCSGEEICFEENRDDFQKEELKYFLRIIEGEVPNTNDMEKAFKMLKCTLGRV